MKHRNESDDMAKRIFKKCTGQTVTLPAKNAGSHMFHAIPVQLQWIDLFFHRFDVEALNWILANATPE